MASDADAYRSVFGEAADLYNKVRPGYPAAALRWALGIPPTRVLDLGAGTGILTRALAGLGYECVAVEPDPRMRAVFQAGSAAAPVPVLDGCAEHIPLADESCDAVAAAECWHWFRAEHAAREIARVLRPGGRLAVIWNFRATAPAWANALTAILARYDGTGATDPPPPLLGSFFGPVHTRDFPHTLNQTPHGLVGLFRSHSFWLAADPHVREALEADLTRLTQTHPQLRGRDEFPMPYRTVVHVADSRPSTR